MSTEVNYLRATADVDTIKKCQGKVEDLQETFEKLSLLLQRAGNEVRLKILFILYEEKKLCVCDLADILGMNVSAISQHLRKLKDGGILRVKREGQTSFYEITEQHRDLFTNCYQLVANEECDL